MNDKQITVVFDRENVTSDGRWDIVGTGSGQPTQVLDIQPIRSGTLGPGPSTATVAGYPAYYAIMTPSGSAKFTGSATPFSTSSTFVFGAKLTIKSDP